MSANLFKSLFFKNTSHLNTRIKMVFTMFITWNMLKKLTKKKALHGTWYDYKAHGDISK